MPYPPRPQLRPLPQFVGTNRPRPDPAVQADVEHFVLHEYAQGRSLRQIAELTDRSHSAVRNILEKHGVRRRGSGAASLQSAPEQPPQGEPSRPSAHQSGSVSTGWAACGRNGSASTGRRSVPAASVVDNVPVSDIALPLPDGSVLLLPKASLSAAVHDELETWSLLADGDDATASDERRGDPAVWTAALGAGSLAIAALQGVIGNAAWAVFPAAARYLRSLRGGRDPLDSVQAAQRAQEGVARVCAVSASDVAVTSAEREPAGTWRVELTVADGRTAVVVLDTVGAAVSIRVNPA